MASVIPGYNYDIFISYRQKDNKGDKWVSEFVDAMKTELESTFKEEISVYFDINPHDGLLETHDVDASLRDKLKCLVFIPIISRTYCDPKSFAWEHEFKTFVDQASHDQFGLKVKLPNGNVANRVLPIRIHDLDVEDIKLCESVMGGVLRGIEFIYKESGFNRPLKPDDDDKNNLNKTRYRNQIAKVALAIKEIIYSIGSSEQKSEKVSKEVPKQKSIPRKNNRTKILAGSIIALALIILGFFLLTKPPKTIIQLDKSLAVLPFVNDSPDKENEYFCNGMMDEILTQLQKIHNMKVKSRTSVEKYRNTNKDIKVIGQELGVSMIMEGSVRKIGDDLRITAQLIDTKSGDHLWAETYDGKYTTKIFDFQSSVAKKVAASIGTEITPKERKRIDAKPTTEISAHNLNMKGQELLNNYWHAWDTVYLKPALNYFNEALKIDNDYLDAMAGKSEILLQEGKYDSALVYSEKILKADRENPRGLDGKARIYWYNNEIDSAIKYWHKILEVNPNDLWTNMFLGAALIYSQNEVIKGLTFCQKAYDLGGDTVVPFLDWIGLEYWYIGDYKKAQKYINKELLRNAGCDVMEEYYMLLFTQGKYNEALNFLDSMGHFTPCGHVSDMMRFCYYVSQRDFKKAEASYNKALDADKTQYFKIDQAYTPYYNYLLKETGRKNEAIAGLNNSIKHYEPKIHKFQDPPSAISRLQIAASYAMLGENKKALDYLSQLEKTGLFEYPITLSFPGFDNLRNDPEFKAIVKRIEDKRATNLEKLKEAEQRGELHL